MDLFELDDICGDGDEPADRVADKIISRPFGYHGSKGRSAKYILPQLPYSDIFVDVFGGCGIITLNRRPSKKLDVYNDAWSGVANFFKVCRDPDKTELLLEQLNMMIPSKELFYEYKIWDVGDDIERAARWYYMIQSSYGSLGRNWGYSRRDFVSNKWLKDLDMYPLIRRRFQEVQVDNEDFRTCFKNYDSPHTVFYCDPPYLGTHQPGSYVHKFTEDDHRDFLSCVTSAKGFVAVSHYPNELYNSRGWSDIKEWTITGSNHGAQTESNHRLGAKIHDERTERLYIKDFE